MSLVALVLTTIISLIYAQSLHFGLVTTCDCTVSYGKTINYSLLIPAWPDTPAESFLILTTSQSITNDVFPVSASTGMSGKEDGRGEEEGRGRQTEALQ